MGQPSPTQACSRCTEYSVPQSGSGVKGLGRAVEPTPTHRILHESLQLELLLLGRILGNDERLRLFLGPGRSHRSGSRTRHSSFPTSLRLLRGAARLDDDRRVRQLRTHIPRAGKSAPEAHAHSPGS